ncbi:MAG TPA: hypothetical protein VIQ31_01740, partial [Phormidium sp.]
MRFPPASFVFNYIVAPASCRQPYPSNEKQNICPKKVFKTCVLLQEFLYTQTHLDFVAPVDN